jgi:hypothetical protein
MGYGIRVTASGGQFQIDSDLVQTKHLAIHTKDSLSASHTTPGKVVTGVGDILFCKASGDNGAVIANVNVINETVGTVSYARGRVHTFYDDIDYLLLKSASNATDYATSIASTDYGIQVKNSASPPQVCFDSRILNFGFEIIQVFPKAEFVGLKYGAANYNYTSNTVFAGAANTFGNVNHASHRKIYVGIFGPQYSPNPSSGITHMAFQYVSSSNKIFYSGVNSFSLPGQQHVPIPNQSEVIVGELFE